MIIIRAGVFIVAFVAIFLVLYFIGGFSYWDWNVARWSQAARVMVASFSAMAACVVAAVVE